MSKHWKKEYFESNSLNSHINYFVEVCGFTFQFGTLDAMREAREWFSAKVHPSGCLPDSVWLRAEHDVAQKWHERLPAFIKKGSKRNRVVKAFDQALYEFSR